MAAIDINNIIREWFDSTNITALPDLLRDIRLQQEVSVVKIAQATQRSARQIQRYERGEVDIPVEILTPWLAELGFNWAIVYAR